MTSARHSDGREGQESQTGPDSQDTRRNVLVITSDEHNAKMLGCAGHPVVKTPHPDRLTAQGTRFTRAYCAQPICAPTRQTFITGLYSFEYGQYGYVFDKRHPTWAHHFKASGYTTACIGKMHTNNEAYHYGFDYRFGRADVPAEILERRRHSPGEHDPHDKALFDAVTGFSKQVFLQVAGIARTMPYVARYDEMAKEIDTGLDLVNGGQQSARLAIAAVTRKVTAILATIG